MPMDVPMSEFFQALMNPNIPFLRFAVIAGLLSSASFGIIGSYVVVKRITSMAGSMAHSVLAGIGFSLFLQGRYGITWFTPMIGAITAAVLSAVIIALVTNSGQQREDTVIGSVWAVGMALGILFISLTPSYVDPMSYLFGNVLLVSRQDLIIIAAMDALIIVFGILLYNQFLSVSFDEEFSRTRGLRTFSYTLILLLFTALAIVLLTTIVGIIMVIALLTLPAAIASLFAKNLWKTMLYSTIFVMIFTFFGMAISYNLNTPSGSTIILFAGALYIIGVVLRRIILGIRKKREEQRIC